MLFYEFFFAYFIILCSILLGLIYAIISLVRQVWIQWRIFFLRQIHWGPAESTGTGLYPSPHSIPVPPISDHSFANLPPHSNQRHTPYPSSDSAPLNFPQATTNNMPPSHTDRLAFPCQFCPYQTNNLTNYKSHARVHSTTSSEQNHHCPYCPYISTQASNLKTHIKKHTGEKPFSCARCNKGFRQHVHLHRHLNIHKKEGNPIGCSHCKSYFP